MRQNTLALASLALAATVFGAPPAAAQEEYRHGYLRHVEPGVTLQRATEASAEEAVANLPFLPGDRVWTDAAGRVEFNFPEGSAVRLDTASKLDYSDHDQSRDERVVLRLWSGSLVVRARTAESAIFAIETPGGLVEVAGPGVIRIDIEGGEIQLSVYEGEASLDTGRDNVRLVAGQRTWSQWGTEPADPAPFDRYAQDDFAAWDGDLESRQAWAANSRRYLPQELEPYAPEFDTHGTWMYEEPVGYVWQPRVATGWAPYSNGRWSWTLYGWTWVPYEPWGWAPHHYGRWGFSVNLGWYWSPGSVWGPGWVNWGVGGGYVGWCASGWGHRPVVPWPRHRGWAKPRGHHGPRGHAVPRGSVGHDRAWTVVRSEDLSHGGYAKRRVDPASVGGLRVAESAHERPDRAVGGLTRTAATPRAAGARPRPGASSRALRGASPVPSGSSGAASARSRGGVVSGAPRASAGRSGAAASRAPSARSRAGSAVGSMFGSRGSSSRPSGAASRARPGRGVTGSSGVSSRPRSGRSNGGVSTSPRSSGSLSGSVSSRPRSRPRSGGVSPGTTGSRGSGVTSRPRSGRSKGGVSTSPRSSGSRSSGVTSRPRSSRPGSSGVSSRPRSGRSSGGVSTSPRRSGSRSSGVSSRPRSSGSRSSGVSSRPRSSGSRSSGVSSRPRSSGSRSSGASSRSRGSSSRGSSSRSGGSRSTASRPRGGSHRQ